MATRLPASQHTREELTALIEGRLSSASAKDELVKLATRLIVEEALEGEAGDALGREFYEHGAQPGAGLPEWICRGRWTAAFCCLLVAIILIGIASAAIWGTIVGALLISPLW
jgi:putative transposase